MLKQLLMSAFQLQVIAVVCLSSASAVAETLTVSDAWARASPPGKRMTAAYATLQNSGRQPLVIIGAASSIAGATSIHETRIDRDRATMSPVKRLTIEAGERVTLQPGGLHIMLMHLKEGLSEGQNIDICLELENNDSYCSAFAVARNGIASHHQH